MKTIYPNVCKTSQETKATRLAWACLVKLARLRRSRSQARPSANRGPFAAPTPPADRARLKRRGFPPGPTPRPAPAGVRSRQHGRVAACLQRFENRLAEARLDNERLA